MAKRGRPRKYCAKCGSANYAYDMQKYQHCLICFGTKTKKAKSTTDKQHAKKLMGKLPESNVHQPWTPRKVNRWDNLQDGWDNYPKGYYKDKKPQNDLELIKEQLDKMTKSINDRLDRIEDMIKDDHLLLSKSMEVIKEHSNIIHRLCEDALAFDLDKMNKSIKKLNKQVYGK
tara:strand:+ start:832 stop:1350 length:519 start_codon:yes stop_codon:yes gene_type:complete